MKGERAIKTRVLEVLAPLNKWKHNCHGASLAVIKSAIGGRVARGWCLGVMSQHSWVTLGDCYDPKAIIIDPTLWSYDRKVKGVWIGTLASGRHKPHGVGSIWAYGKPAPPIEAPIRLKPRTLLSAEASYFLSLLGPLDLRGWNTLANGPMEDWPAGEVLAAMDDTKELSSLVPVDRLGMLTNRNPGGLYLP